MSITEEKLIAVLKRWTFPASTGTPTITSGIGANVVEPLERHVSTPLAPGGTEQQQQQQLQHQQLLQPSRTSMSTISEVVGGTPNGDRIWELDVADQARGRITKVQFRLSNVSCSLDAPPPELNGLAMSELARSSGRSSTPTHHTSGTHATSATTTTTTTTTTSGGPHTNQGPMGASTPSDYSASLAHETVRRITLRMIDAFGKSVMESSALLDLAQFENPDDLEYGEGDESIAAVLLYERQQQRRRASGGAQTNTNTSASLQSSESSEIGFVLDASSDPGTTDVPAIQVHRRRPFRRSDSKQRNSLASTAPFGGTTTTMAPSSTIPSIEVSPPFDASLLEASLAESVIQLRADLLRNIQTEPGVDPMLMVSDPQEIAQMIRKKIASAGRSQDPSQNNDSSYSPSPLAHHQQQQHVAADNHQQQYDVNFHSPARGERDASARQLPQRQSLQLGSQATGRPPLSPTAPINGHNSPTSTTAPHSPRAEEAMRYLLTKYFADPSTNQQQPQAPAM
ncbi:Hypothetical protein, putative [Bodo saltans]|uniref:Uncharacterized protein n=1 Tax=Bodo saltans TaxID=75058 RepID=A0A0S4JAC3_BODSA|nr:Hypothetical protein, putative [Bodo saltans]|eukprot:CUG88452.1 Hypothetical protein, putative [Bodo saltans]